METYDVAFDHQFLETEKYDAKPTYKKDVYKRQEYGIIETWFTIHESIADILGITYFLIVAGNDFFLISVCSLGCVESVSYTHL